MTTHLSTLADVGELVGGDSSRLTGVGASPIMAQQQGENVRYGSSLLAACASMLLTTSAVAQNPPPGTCSGADVARFSPGTTVTVKINFTTFSNQNPAWIGLQQEAIDSIIQATDRWSSIPGTDIKLVSGGITSATHPGTNEILILMEASAPLGGACGGTCLAEARIFNDNTIAFFFRNPNPAPWALGHPSSGAAVEFQAVLMHELGHMLGLIPHSGATGSFRAVMGSADPNCGGFYNWLDHRSGPNINDVTRLRLIYPTATSKRLRERFSDNEGASWSFQSNGLNTDSTVTSTLAPSGLRDSGTAVVAFRNPSLQVEVVVGSDVFFTSVVRRTTFPVTTLHAPAIAGESNEWIVAYVDASSDSAVIRLKYTSDAGATWTDRGGVVGRTVGTPALVKTASGTWYLAYTLIDFSEYSFNGAVVLRRSTDDGATWTSVHGGQDNGNNFLSWTGVALTRLGNDIREVHDREPFGFFSATERTRVVATSWNATSTTWPHPYAATNGVTTTTMFSTTAPSIVRNSAGRFILGALDKGGSTVRTVSATENGTWNAPVVTGASGFFSLAADKDNSRVLLFYFF